MDTIIDLSNSVKNLAITLKYLNCQQYLYNPQLLQDIITKLTPNLKIEWGKYILKNIKSTSFIKVRFFPMAFRII